MKKMVLSKAKYYAQKIYNLEQSLQKATEKEEINKIASNIQDIVDEICENFEPTAMYKVDEQIYEIDRKKRKQDI